MPSTYTLNNGIELIGTGEQSGTWGDTTNTNLELLDTALDGQVTITATSAGSDSSPNDLPISDGTASNGRNRMVIITSATDLGADVYYQLTPNDAEKIIYVRNDLNAQDLVLFQGTYNASNAYTVPNGKTAIIFFDGNDTGAVAANVFNNAHFDAMNIVGAVDIGGTLTVDTVNEFTADAGVTIETVLLKDDVVNATDIETSTISANDGTLAINIADSTGAVDIDTSLNVDGTVSVVGTTSSKLEVYSTTADTSDSAALDLMESSTGASFGTTGAFGFRLKYDGDANDLLLYSGAGTTTNTRIEVQRDSRGIGFNGATISAGITSEYGAGAIDHFRSDLTGTNDYFAIGLTTQSASLHSGVITVGNSGSEDTNFYIRTANNGAEKYAIAIDEVNSFYFYEDTGSTQQLIWNAADEELKFNDNVKAVFGTGGDLEIYHDASNSYISDTGQGNLNFDTAGTYYFNVDGTIRLAMAEESQGFIANLRAATGYVANLSLSEESTRKWSLANRPGNNDTFFLSASPTDNTGSNIDANAVLSFSQTGGFNIGAGMGGVGEPHSYRGIFYTGNDSDLSFFMYGSVATNYLAFGENGTTATITSGSSGTDSTNLRFQTAEGGSESLSMLITSVDDVIIGNAVTTVNTDGARLAVNQSSYSSDSSLFYDGLQISTQGLTASSSADQGVSIGFIGSDGSSNRSFGRISAFKANATSGNYDSYMAFYTRKNGGALGEKMKLDAEGALYITDTSNDTKMQLGGEASDSTNYLRFTKTSGTEFSIMAGHGGALDNSILLRTSDGGTERNHMLLSGGSGATYFYTDASHPTAIRIPGQNNDTILLRVDGGSGNTDDGQYGFSLAYTGDETGNNNAFEIRADNQTAASQAIGMRMLQTGQTAFPQGITLGSDTDVLSEYEEGTWTPTYEPTSGSFTSITYDSATFGTYTKVGRMVTLVATLDLDALSFGTGSGNLLISGMPFTELDSVSSYSGGVSQQTGWDTAPTQVFFRDDGYLGLGYIASSGSGTYSVIDVSDMNSGNRCRIRFTLTYFTS